MTILDQLKETIQDLEMQLQIAEMAEHSGICITKEKGYFLLAMAKRIDGNIERAKKELKDEHQY